MPKVCHVNLALKPEIRKRKKRLERVKKGLSYSRLLEIGIVTTEKNLGINCCDSANKIF